MNEKNEEKKIIIFDMGGVIITDLEDDFYSLLIPKSNDEEKKKITKHAKSLYILSKTSIIILFKIGEIDEITFYKELFDENKTNFKKELINEHNLQDNFVELKSFMEEKFWDNFKIFEKTIKVIENYSKSNDIKIGILSNHTTFWKNLIFKKYSFLNSIFKNEEINLFSCDIQLCKPNKNCYEFLVQNLRNYFGKFQKIYFVDNKIENTESAQNSSSDIQSFLFSSYNMDIENLNKFLESI
jgi:FMN phosphatase YigB (HAD superfamily)